MNKSKIKYTLLVGLSFLMLGGCSQKTKSSSSSKPETVSVSPSRDMTYQYATKHFSKTVKLAFFSSRVDSNHNGDGAAMVMGYYRQGKLHKTYLDSEDDNVVEEIDVKATTPYDIYTNDCNYIHRPPYIQYNQPAVTGKVTGKTVK